MFAFLVVAVLCEQIFIDNTLNALTEKSNQLYASLEEENLTESKALAQEVAKKRVTVNAVAPGFVKTDMVEGLDEKALSAQIPAGRFGTPEEVAAVVAFLASPEAAYVNGEVIAVNGALYT